MTGVKRLVLLVAVVLASVLPGSIPEAHAAAQAAGWLSGSGTISPGLTFTPTYQYVSFSGTFVGEYEVDTAVAAGALYCSFSGGSTVAATVVSDAGVLNGLCTTGTPSLGAGTLSSSWTYIRVGSYYMVSYDGSLGVGGSPATTVAGQGVFRWFPTSYVVTSYVMEGTVAFAGV